MSTLAPGDSPGSSIATAAAVARDEDGAGGSDVGAAQIGEPLGAFEVVESSPLVLEHVTKRFGGVLANDDLSLRVEPGEALGIIGPNGAGKSTLLRLIGGLHAPSAGTITLGATRIDGLRPDVVNRHGIGLANQIPKPFPALSVAENVQVAATSHRRKGSPRARVTVDDVLELCQLGTRADARAGSLGLLDLKRLELARVLATGARVLLLDEVAAGLVGDELTAAIQLVRSIHRSGRSMIIVEHVQRVIHEIVSRVVVLDWGKLIAEGTPAAVAADERVRDVYLGRRAQREAGSVSSFRAETTTGTANSSALLEVENVCAGYGSLVALDCVDLRIGEGEVVSVLGANGAGKSTLAKVVSGHVPARSGRLLWRAREVTVLPTYKRARLGIAHSPEGRRIFPDHTVSENLLLGAAHSASRARRTERLEWVLGVFPALRKLAARRAGLLSGGEQQMLAIGRALMAEPSLLICDELSLGLAPAIVDTLYDTLVDVRASGIALLLIEQNTSRSLAVSDRAYVLHRGRVTYAGAPEPLLDETFLVQRYFHGEIGGRREPDEAGGDRTGVPTGK